MKTPTFFAIRHIPTGNFLPQLQGQRGGYTHIEHCAWWEMPMRLFKTKRNAKLALNCWLKGKYMITISRSGDWGGVDDNIDLIIDPVPERKADEMEIVEFDLHETSGRRPKGH